MRSPMRRVLVGHLRAVGCAAALALARILALAAIVARFTSALSLAGVLTLASVLFLHLGVGRSIGLHIRMHPRQQIRSLNRRAGACEQTCKCCTRDERLL